MRLNKMIDLCDTLTPIEVRIASYIQNHREQVLDMKITELADELFVSKSAVHRCIKKIGFNGFNELKVCIAKEQDDQEHEDHSVNVNSPFSAGDDPIRIASKLMDVYQATVQSTFECLELKPLDEVAKLLDSAKVIDIYTHAHNLNVAENFEDKMLTIGKRVNCQSNFYNQRLNVLASDPGHVAVILSYSGKASWIVPILQKLDEKGIKVVQIGKIGSNDYPQYVDYFLGVSNDEDNRDRLSQFSSHIAMQYMMDVLYGAIYNLDRMKNSKYVYDSIDYMDDRKF